MLLIFIKSWAMSSWWNAL